MEYNNTERNAMIQNGYNVATQGNGTRNSDWPTCVGCAIISRSLQRNGEDVPDVCQQCFTKYCWNGTLASQDPPPYFPEMILSPIDVKSGAASLIPSWLGMGITVALLGFFAI